MLEMGKRVLPVGLVTARPDVSPAFWIRIGETLDMGLLSEAWLGVAKSSPACFKTGWMFTCELLFYVEKPASVDPASRDPDASKIDPWPNPELPMILPEIFLFNEAYVGTFSYELICCVLNAFMPSKLLFCPSEATSKLFSSDWLF